MYPRPPQISKIEHFATILRGFELTIVIKLSTLMLAFGGNISISISKFIWIWVVKSNTCSKLTTETLEQGVKYIQN